MSLYNLLFGANPDREALVAVVNEIQPIDVGRFRDVWVEKKDGELAIAIYTRNGGGNREDYQNQIESMQEHPWYVSDADDYFDETYATFYFRIPKDLDPKILEKLYSMAVDPVDTSAVWQEVIEQLEKQNEA